MKKLNARMFCSLAVASVMGTTVGCTTEKVDLGDDTGVTGSSLSDYEGTWEGYAEAYRFNDQSDKIRIALDGSGHGVLEVGDSAPLPEPDANLGYPPREDDGSLPGRSSSLVAGFSYPLMDAQVQSSRIRLKLIRSEVYREWCELQTPVLDDVNSNAIEVRYSCLPNIGFGQDEDGCFLGGARSEDMPIDCGLLDCLSACQCTESACGIDGHEPEMILDAALKENGEVLEGTLLELGERITVRMTRTN